MNNFEKMLNDAFGAAAGGNRDRGAAPGSFMDIFGPLADELRKSAPKGEGGFPFPFGANNPFNMNSTPSESRSDVNDSLTEDDEDCSCDDCMHADNFEGYEDKDVCENCGVDLGSIVEADVDVAFEDDRVSYAIDLPGVSVEDIDVELMDGHAVIRAERFNKFDENAIDFVYSTVLHLDPKTDFDKVDTEYENGVLMVVAPFREDLKPRTVKVKEKHAPSAPTNSAESEVVDAPKPPEPAKKTAAKKSAPKDVK